MVQFGEYLENCAIKKYEDKYIQYGELKDLLSEAKKGQLHKSSKFYQLLDSSFAICRNFAEEWLITLEQATSWTPNIVSEALELNQFVFVNQEAVRKIIKKHDKNIPSCQLLVVWRYSLYFG